MRTGDCVRCDIETDKVYAGQPFTSPDEGPFPVSEITDYSGRPFRERTIEEIEKSMQRFGPGSRGIVVGRRPVGRSGHAFDVLNIKGKVLFLDGQTGKSANRYSDYESFEVTYVHKGMV
jgi:hypothetical protein